MRLRHPEFKYATHYVPARYNEDSIEYTAKIDLGDPDHILPKNGEYVFEVLVGDEILERTRSWDVTTFMVDFRTEIKGPPLNDASYPLKDPIENYFAPPAKKAPFVIPASICAGIGLTILLFFYVILFKVGVNLRSIPTSFFGSICTLLFIGTLLGLFALLILFWVKLNLLQMLPLLLISSILILSISFKFLSNRDIRCWKYCVEVHLKIKG